MQSIRVTTLQAVPAGFLVCALLLAGCGGGAEQGATIDVTGKVTRDTGEPLSGARIWFTSRQSGAAYGADLGADGTYELQLLDTQPGEVFGVSFGPTEATGENVELDEGGIPKPNPLPPMPDRYTEPATSGLEATLGEGSSQTFDFKLTSE